MPDAKKKILIVDDELSISELLSDTISQYGFECLTARNGLEGLHVILMENPDLILLDLRMPEMDGLTMLQKLREKGTAKNIPVIILSTVNDEKSVSEAMEYGVSNFIEKSNWNVSELVGRIRESLEGKK